MRPGSEARGSDVKVRDQIRNLSVAPPSACDLIRKRECQCGLVPRLEAVISDVKVRGRLGV